MTEEEWLEEAKSLTRIIEKVQSAWGVRLVPTKAGVKQMLKNAIYHAEIQSTVWKDNARALDKAIELSQNHLLLLEDP